MGEETTRFSESKLMEPIYRMYKVISEKDELKAQTFMAVVVQYISENFKGIRVTPRDVQNVIRAVLLHDADGTYYGMYVYNEIQVKVTEWITILSADLPVTIETLGAMANQLAEALEGKVVVMLSPEDVVLLMEQIAASVDEVLLQRIQLNKGVYLLELGSFLANGEDIKH